MKKSLLASVAAAALIITTGLAGAQGPGSGSQSGSQGAAPSAPSAAPPSSAGSQGSTLNRSDSPASSDSMKSDSQKSSQSGDRMQRDGNQPNQRAQDNVKQPNGMKAESPAGTKSGADKAAQDQKAPASSTTTGQAGAGAKISTEQRTQIRTVITQQNVKPVTNVNFSISVGSRVPRGGVSFHALPTQVISIYPEWRGYEYFLVGSEIIVVNPRTLEIVAVLEA